MQQSPYDQNQYPQTPDAANQFLQDFIKAALHFCITLGYFLFALPFGLWCKAIQNLGSQRESGNLRIGKIRSPWPFFSFLKTFFLEFAFDAASFIAYPLGLFAGVLSFIISLIDHAKFGEALALMFLVWIISYYMPVAFAWGRDGFQLFVIMPIRKFLSWLRKPAQHLDLVQKVDMDITEK